ncbi:MAG: hypothetical protein ABS82_01135 [Rhodanobacter sp. SCN 67-45]|nr:MAG: hypothetical protein ABS82_01135 [Rhodanobacter sp. SCN 67-45]
MKMTLPEFITELGDAEFAHRTSTPIRTVQSWRRRERVPRPSQAQEIIRLFGDRLDFEGIYGSVATEGGSPAEAAHG